MYLPLTPSVSPTSTFLLTLYTPVTPQYLHVLKEVKWLSQVHNLVTLVWVTLKPNFLSILLTVFLLLPLKQSKIVSVNR